MKLDIYHLSFNESMKLAQSNLRLQRSHSSGYFELIQRETLNNTKITRNMYAKGSFQDPTVYSFTHKLTGRAISGTMKQVANLSTNNNWHRGSWCGTQLVKRVGSQRSLLIYKGVA